MTKLRTMLTLAGLSQAGVCLALCVQACSESGDPAAVDAGGGEDAAPDQTGLDASVADTSVPDAAVDASPAPVTVSITHDRVPAPNVRVLFMNAADQVLTSAVTSAKGTATADVPPGGKVVAISDVSRQVYAWLDVKAGDPLALEIPKAPLAFMNVTMPSKVGATNYTFESRCGSIRSVATSDSVEVPPGCTTADVVVRWSSSNTPGGFFLAPAQTFAAGGTLDLTARTYGPMVSRTAKLTNVPSIGSFTIAGRLVFDGHVAIDGINDDVASSDGGIVTITGPVDDLPTAKLLTSFQTLDEGALTRRVLSLGPQNQAPVDVGASLLPTVLPATYSPSTRTLAWAEGAGGAAPSAVIVRFSTSVTRDAGFATATWVVVAPHSTSITLPVLPADLGDYAADGPLGSGRIFSVKSAAGVDGVRRAALAVSGVTELLTADGVLSVSERFIGAQ